MNEYIQEKDIKSLVVRYGTCDLQDISKIKKLEKEAYNRGVEDSLKCVPDNKNTESGIGLPYENQPEIYGNRRKVAFGNGFNDCRQQTIDNIIKLLTNK